MREGLFSKFIALVNGNFCSADGYGRAGIQEIPQFVIEPPSTLTFLNTTGATLNCAIRHSQVRMVSVLNK